MKYIKSFNESNQFETDPEEVRSLVRKITREAFSHFNVDIMDRITIHPNGVVDVNGSIMIAQFDPSLNYELPVKFGRVSDTFGILSTSKLTTLEGCPDSCNNFTIDGLKIESLVGGPKYVGNNYYASRCDLTSLEGCPEYIPGNLIVEGNKFTNLEGLPKRIQGELNLSSCPLENLVGMPESVGRLTLRDTGHLTSLEGFPKYVNHAEIYFGSSFINVWDPRPLKGCEIEILSLRGYGGLPELLELFNFTSSGIPNLNSYLLKMVTQKFIDSLDYNYIRGVSEPYITSPLKRREISEKPQINLFRLHEAFEEFGGKPNFFDRKSKKMHHYNFVDEEGKIVDYEGKVVTNQL